MTPGILSRYLVFIVVFVQLFCIFLKIENWPLTDYGMFRWTESLETSPIYLLAAGESNDKFAFIPNEIVRKTTFSYNFLRAVNNKDWHWLTTRTKPIWKSLKNDSNFQNAHIYLVIQRIPIFDKSGKLTFKDKVVHKLRINKWN